MLEAMYKAITFIITIFQNGWAEPKVKTEQMFLYCSTESAFKNMS